MSVILPSSDSRHLAWGLFEQLGVIAKVSVQYLVTSTWETLPYVDYNKGRIPSCWPRWSCLHSALAGRRSIISLALKAVLANRSGVEAECHLSGPTGAVSGGFCLFPLLLGLWESSQHHEVGMRLQINISELCQYRICNYEGLDVSMECGEQGRLQIGNPGLIGHDRAMRRAESVPRRDDTHFMNMHLWPHRHNF